MARFSRDFREISEVFDGFMHNFRKLAKADLHAVHNAASATDDEAMRGKIFADQSAQDYARDHAEQPSLLYPRKNALARPSGSRQSLA